MCKMSRCSASGSPAWIRQGRGRSHDPGALRHHAGPPAAGDPDLRHHPPGSWNRWETGWPAGASPRSGWRLPGTTGSRCSSCSNRGFDCVLYNAAQVKALPGRPKTDLDSIWLAKITERGSAAASFVPPEPIRKLRTCTRYRRRLTQARTAEKQRAEKLPEDGHLKLSSVISGIHGVSGRDMLDAIAAGQRDPRALAELARGKMRGKIKRLEEALHCAFFTAEHAAVLAMMLVTIDHYTAQIQALTEKIEELTEPYLHQTAQLDEIDGVGLTCAQDIIAEIGTDMTVFPTAARLVSWAKWSPQVKQSAGKRKGSNATGRGNPCLSAALGEVSVSAGRTQSFPGAKYRRMTRRCRKRKPSSPPATPRSPSCTP